ncbi:Nascent polypeptide-associated complex subunit beta [Mortierella alpina]|nr:Nascent polypeptide-associated complex subunit beta [Mortierella alpina]
MNPEKLAKLQKANQGRAKGAPRRNAPKVHRPVAQDDRKLMGALEKLALVNQPYVEEVNMFLEQGTVLHFRAPRVQAAAASNIYAIYGRGEEKELTELVPGILNQLGPDALANLRRLAQSYQQTAAGQAAMAAAGVQPDDEDDVPDLVESFEETSIEEDKVESA